MKSQCRCNGAKQERGHCIALQVADHDADAGHPIQFRDENTRLLVPEVMQHLRTQSYVHAAVSDGERQGITGEHVVCFRSRYGAEDK